MRVNEEDLNQPRQIQFWAACVQMWEGKHAKQKISSLSGTWTNTTDTKMSFCIEHTIQKPLKRSAPTSESFIRSLHPLYRYNFHFLNGPLLVSLPNAPRHTTLFSDTNPVPVGGKNCFKKGVKNCYFFFKFWKWGFEQVSRPQWSCWFMNSYWLLPVQVREGEALKLRIV